MPSNKDDWPVAIFCDPVFHLIKATVTLPVLLAMRQIICSPPSMNLLLTNNVRVLLRLNC